MGLLRLYLALCVVATHIPGANWFPSIYGSLAVEGFYIISGFYMALILTTRQEYSSYKIFISNRGKKIYLTYFLALIILLPAKLSFLQSEIHLNNLKWPAIALATLLNLTVIGSDLLFYLQSSNSLIGMKFCGDLSQPGYHLNNLMVIPQSWSLSLEIVFYLIAPIIIRRHYLTFFLFITSIFSRLLITSSIGEKSPWDYRFFPNELCLFILGIFAFQIYSNIEKRNKNPQFKLKSFIYLEVICFIVIFRHLVVGNSFFYTENIFNLPLYKIIFFIFMFINVPIIFHITKKSKFDREIGDFSYPVYLLHLGIFEYISFRKELMDFKFIVLLTFLVSYFVVKFQKRIDSFS